MCHQGLAIDTLSSQIELQKANGAPITAAYKHHEQVEEMILACSQSLKEKLKTELANAHFIGVMTDESCDIAIYKKLIIYVKIVVNGKSKVVFAENRNVPEGTANTIVGAIRNFLNDNTVPPEKVAGLGSDEAAVMTGVRNGVGVQLKQVYPLLVHVHCMAHRLALAVSQAAGEIPQLKAYQLDINNIYQHYQYSAVRYNKLREIQQVVDETPVALKQPHTVRWLSLDHAVDAINKSWASLVAVLGEEAANGNAVARGLYAKME